MAMQPRSIASAVMAQQVKPQSNIVFRLITSTTMKMRAIASIITNYFLYNQNAVQYESSDITYNFSTSNGIMSEHLVSSATMKGR